MKWELKKKNRWTTEQTKAARSLCSQSAECVCVSTVEKILGKDYVLAYNERVKVWWMMTVEMMKVMKIDLDNNVTPRSPSCSVQLSISIAIQGTALD